METLRLALSMETLNPKLQIPPECVLGGFIGSPALIRCKAERLSPDSHLGVILN